MVGNTSDVRDSNEQMRDRGEAVSKAERNTGSLSWTDKLKNKLKDTHLYDVKVKATHFKHRVGKLENLVNTNHRHDEEHEQETDRKRTLTSEAHRFQSFAPERDGNQIKWYVDGRDYFHAVSIAFERAKETIYIEDWWLSPELFLRRPAHFSQEWRLDQILKRAAERGVKIYVIVYKEVSAALTCNSAHTKHALHALCPEGTPGHGNIKVMRHPDHNFFENAGDMTFYWAHHEKFIVIDYDMAFIGGLDLCFGRWDTKSHPLADVHPSGVQNEVWPGQDYNNNRIMDFQTVEDWKSNELSKTEYGRMPWHDVHMGLIGPCIYDIAEHFVLRWNFVKRDKYKRDERYDWLLLHGRTGDNEDLIGVQRPKHPVGDYVTHPLTSMDAKAGNPNQGKLVTDPRPRAQRLNSSGGLDEFRDAGESVNEHGYTDDQHRTPSTWMDDKREWLGDKKDELTSHKPHLHPHGNSQKGDVPQLPDQAALDKAGAEPSKQENYHMTGNDPANEGTVSASGGMAEKSKGYHSEIAGSGIVEGGQGTVHAQLVRSSADWSSGILTESSIQNAYCQVIRAAKHFVYIENQFFITATGTEQAPVHNLIGAAIADAVISAGKEGRKFRVIIVIPAIPGFAGDLRSEAAAGTRAIMDYQYKAICRGEHSIFGKVKAAGIDPTQHIFVFNLRSYDRINRTPELKKQEDESGVTYQELQRAEAEEIAGSMIHGAPGEEKEKKKERRHERARKLKAEGKSSAHQGQPTGAKSLLKRNYDKEVHEGSSESESDVEEDGRRMKTQRPGEMSAQQKKEKWEASRGENQGEGKDVKVQSEDSIARDALIDTLKPSEENYAGRKPGFGGEEHEGEELRQQEAENFVQEELYIHAKLLIADDRIAICGSSNINDRSQLGFHDSELSIVMEDTHTLPSKMDGAEYMAGHHAASLRRILWREHLGLIPHQPINGYDDPNAQPPGDCANDWLSGDAHDAFVADPLSDDLWKMWTDSASTNTLVFRHLFHADPDDNIKTFEDYDKFMPKGAHKQGHLFDVYQPVDLVRQELDKIKGHLVWMPLKFLEDANMAEAGLQVNSWTESIYT